ncbi:MAG: MBL fold metallo-hydrolase [Clostridiales Family XIII bacterium]|jgi:glyoxylase-like metal-dependent hydrolase (beta-lactamase superfamily II)|nr:MBL fold metallo-hydrolase [Clostridiales Family XIII bacterium]
MKIYSIVAGSIGTNSYLLLSDDEKEAAIIDPAVFIPEFAEKIDGLGATLNYILLTHGHGDHTGGIPEFKERFPDAKLAAGRHEEELLRNASVNYSSVILGAEVNPMPDILLKDGDELKVGNLTLKVIETPGHTAGGVSYLVNNEVLFSGDTLFRGSVGRTDLPTGDMITLLRSIREKLFTLDDEVRVLPGHMQDTTIGREKRTNPFV